MITADDLRKMQTAQRGTFVERIACCDLDGIEAKLVEACQAGERQATVRLDRYVSMPEIRDRILAELKKAGYKVSNIRPDPLWSWAGYDKADISW